MGHVLRRAGGKVTMLRGDGEPLQRTVRSKDGKKARITATVPDVEGMVGQLWVVLYGGRLRIIARPVEMRFGDLDGLRVRQKLTHDQLWASLRGRGAEGLHELGLPLLPLVHGSADWPRGRVLFDCATRRFVLRSDAALHAEKPLAAICDVFGIDSATVILEGDGTSRAQYSIG